MFSLKKIYHHIVWVFQGVQVFALVGKSGSGKSFRAQLVADKYGIDFIIDDGLLIRGEKIVAGTSAKKEKGVLTAIKTALFANKDHADEVRKTLEREKFKRILIIGTSIPMVKKIASTLNLPQPTHIIKIQDIATLDEIEKARRSRDEEGKHIIPVPAIEIKKNYPHIFFESIKVLLKRKFSISKKNKEFEKTVVRPDYSRKGKVAISQEALTQMVLHCVNEFDSSIKVSKIIIKNESDKYIFNVFLDIPYGTQISGDVHRLQRYIVENIERFTGIIIDEVNLTVSKISFMKKIFKKNSSGTT
ncbi:MAG: hypothetical protein DRP57_01775 [Spirochaetes bacterium]|nr:MAG: hypothetical protein DRP57_01775 [Spirochaetota bacterium]